MHQLIDELKSVSGVIGACTYSPQNGLQESNLPGIFKPEKLAAIGRQFTKLYTVGQMSFSDLTELTLNYDESVVVARANRSSVGQLRDGDHERATDSAIDGGGREVVQAAPDPGMISSRRGLSDTEKRRLVG